MDFIAHSAAIHQNLGGIFVTQGAGELANHFVPIMGFFHFYIEREREGPAQTVLNARQDGPTKCTFDLEMELTVLRLL